MTTAVLLNPAPAARPRAGFGPREPIKTSLGLSPAFHRGRDYSLGGKSFPVLAAAAGRIKWAYQSTLGGLEVLIEHKTAFGYLATRYGHLAAFAPGIRAGVTVAAHQYLGPAGSTGRADGVHLHFEVFTDSRLGARQVDPDPYMLNSEDDDDMALTPAQAAGLEWLGSEDRRKALDLAAFQTGELHARRGILDTLALNMGNLDLDGDADPEAIAAAVVEHLGRVTAEHLAGAILDAARALPGDAA